MEPELIPVTDRSYYIQSPAKIGLVLLEGDEVCLIDGGNDKSAARHVRKILDAHGWKLRAIYCTHSHADHIGGCKYLQTQTGCRIYAPGIECDFTRHPILEPALLYGGNPGAELKNKFFLAQESDAEPLREQDLPPGFSIIPLPGHSFDMVGYRTPDDVVYLADSLISRATLEKYRICYIYDVAAHLRTLEMLQTLPAAHYIPAHAEATDDITELVRLNTRQVHTVAQDILTYCATPQSTEDILQRIFTDYQIPINYAQYALLGCTVRSYLTWLVEIGRMRSSFEGHRLLWHSISTQL